MNIKGTETAENLLKAFAGESQAINRYTYYASVAKKEGYMQIANIFLETADNEKEHAKRFFSFLARVYEGDNLLIHAEYPIGLSSTLENLGYAADGEEEEWTYLYPMFADVAEKEGFDQVALCFRKIAEAEENHETRFRTLCENLIHEKVFSRHGDVRWKCLKCGYIHQSNNAPESCPACLHLQEHFELFKETY